MNFDLPNYPLQNLRDVFDGYMELINSTPVTVFLASYKITPYPFKLQNVNEAYISHCRNSAAYLLDSHIDDESVTNQKIIETTEKIQPQIVFPKDYLCEQKKTTESILEFLDLWEDAFLDNKFNSLPIIPLQPPHDEHYREIVSEAGHYIQKYDLDMFSAGGLARSSFREQAESLEKLRDVAGEDAFIHGLGMGGSNIKLLLYLRENPGLLDSLDNSTPGKTLRNGQFLNKNLKPEDYYHTSGKYGGYMGGLAEFFMGMQINHVLSPHLSTDAVEELEELLA